MKYWLVITRLMHGSCFSTLSVDAIMSIKTAYEIRRNWMGDPCVPLNYIWEGLNCSYPDLKPPTIISLDLSSSRLTGEISTLLANLTSIQSL
ncbi:putative LRR receptor-like serine/threonine-protein kinase isoform X3 [Cinnamomum micranthum f. kanehirae]|uniref:Putative LRR receptor-like serine/threonine-protein kinase isoform X3 n=1 Tax=Cinnamomum micranthum f. kanehirae TaxID=337451 RepID=A0A443NHZ7_9MAGN|nr:putative LRR receptor-like serine/threonine-protein kinase isoform X3 [Cinnamomum micranthum f. kanehirae]